MGRATAIKGIRIDKELFQSTPSVGRATRPVPDDKHTKTISIHALRGEGDEAANRSSPPLRHFNPRPPWGGRRRVQGRCGGTRGFQSTPSVGRATARQRRQPSRHCGISIHALRGEGDTSRAQRTMPLTSFQSTPSVGRATIRPCGRCSGRGYFNPRPPWGGRQVFIVQYNKRINFNPRPPWGGRQFVRLYPNSGKFISIHALRGEGDSAVVCRQCG